MNDQTSVQINDVPAHALKTVLTYFANQMATLETTQCEFVISMAAVVDNMPTEFNQLGFLVKIELVEQNSEGAQP